MATSFSKKYRPKDAANYLEVKQATLDYWRWCGKGPAYLKLGGSIFYLEADLNEFLQSCRRMPAELAEAR